MSASGTGGGRLRFLGHSTVLIEMDGARILTDPVLRHRVGPIVRIAPPHQPEWIAGIDAVLISHAHLDHLDLPTLRSLEALAPDFRVIVPPGLAGTVRAAGIARVEELLAGGSVMVGGLTVTATPAVHSGFRPPSGPRAAALGYVVRSALSSVYFAGDTDLYPGMTELAPGLDVAMLPVWGWGPRLGPGHMNPERAAQALTLLRPRLAIPIHWGTYWAIGMGRVRRHRTSEPPHEFAAMARDIAPGVRVAVIEPGGDPIAIPASHVE